MAYIGVPPADRTSGARVRDEFTADGTQVCFQLSQEVPGSFESNIITVVENVIQEPVSAYIIVDTVTVGLTSISGTFVLNETVTGGTSAATGTVIQVNTSSIVIKVATGTFQAAETITGGGSSATATISTLTTNVGKGLNFTGTPPTGGVIYVLHQASATYNLKPAAGSVTPETLSDNLRTFTVDKFTATASQTAFTLTATPVSVKSILVFVDGVMQTETTHYTLSAATLTMGSALAEGQQVTVVHLGFSTVSRTAFTDGSVTTNQLADGAVTAAKIANGTIIAADIAAGGVAKEELDVASSSGTGAMIPPTGTTDQRPTASAGQLRFNTTLSLMEYYDGTNWKSIDAPPVISSVSGTINENTNSTITINGSNFQSGATVYIVGAAVSNTDRALTTTVVSSSQVTAATAAASVNYVGGASFDIKVANSSGLSTTLASAGAVDRDPTWTTASGNVGTVYDSTRGSVSTIATLVATDAESTAVTYAVTSGSLPSGISLNSSTGVISRTGTISAEASDTTYTFSVTPTSNGQDGVARSFNIVVKAPAVVSFTSTGSSTWTVPTGISSVQVLVVAGGGAGGTSTNSAVNGGGGGAGGLVLHNTFPVTPAGSVSYTVGAGGSGPAIASVGSQTPQSNGGNSVFGALTALGGGAGGSGSFPSPDGYASNIGQPGGSGGGNAGWAGGGTPGIAGGSGTQPAQSNPGATANGGYPGGQGGNPNTVGGGGGGATARGTGAQDTNSAQGTGGAGYSTSISGSSVTYAGGGGAGGYPGTVAAAGAGGPGGGGPGANGGTGSAGNAGTTNRGGGGGGCSGTSGGGTINGGSGGPGIIIVKY